MNLCQSTKSPSLFLLCRILILSSINCFFYHHVKDFFRIRANKGATNHTTYLSLLTLLFYIILLFATWSNIKRMMWLVVAYNTGFYLTCYSISSVTTKVALFYISNEFDNSIDIVHFLFFNLKTHRWWYISN